jgi:hypothetical protein
VTLTRLLRRVAERLYIDIGSPDATTFIAGMGRSGTTWVGSIVNHDFSYRILFEPFRPHHVPAAAAFGPFGYVRPADRDPAKLTAAESILSGRTPRGTLDRDHRGLIFRRRLIKAIRCNLMLAWLRSLRPTMPLVLVIRNPLAVAASWLRLDWGHIAGGAKLELDVILGQEALLHDFPLVRESMRRFDRRDAFERHVFQWCVLHLVPFHQLHTADAHVIFYEDIVRDPLATVRRLAEYLQVKIDGPSRDRALPVSKADFLGRGNDVDRVKLLEEWRSVLTPQQVTHGREILAAFGLDRLYDADGLPSGDDARSGVLRGAARIGT